MFWSQVHLKSFCLCEVYLLTFTILENETEKFKKKNQKPIHLKFTVKTFNKNNVFL